MIKFLCISLLIFQYSCNNVNIKNMANNDSLNNSGTTSINQKSNISEIANYRNKNNYLLAPLMQSLLKNNGYQFPSSNEFRKYILQYFSVDIDTSKYDDIILPQIEGDYVVIRDKYFICPLSGELELEALKKELQAGKNKNNNGLLINFNKLLFNKRQESLEYFLANDTIVLRDILVGTGFYLNNKMFNKIINSVDENDNDALGDIIFDIYKPQGMRLRLNLLRSIAEYRIDLLINIIDHFPQDFLRSNNILTKEEINYTIANVLILEIDHKKKDLVQYFLDEHPDYKNILKKENYYNFQKLKNYIIEEYQGNN